MIGNRRLGLMIATVMLLAACGAGESESTSTTAEAGSTTQASVTTTVGETTTTEGSGGPEVVIEGFAFDAPSTVAVGDTVLVTNRDAAPHTWTAEGDVFDSGALGQGDTFEFTFEEAGQIDFFCAIHPTQMTGTITVEG